MLRVLLSVVAVVTLIYGLSYMAGAQDIVGYGTLSNGDVIQCAKPDDNVWVCQEHTK